MTMYARVLTNITVSISNGTGESFILDYDPDYQELPLWAAQREEFQRLWNAEKVEVATDPEFLDIITEIPASEIPGSVDTSLFAQLDEGGRIPQGIIPSSLYLEETKDLTGHTVLRLASPGNATNHFAFSAAHDGQAPVLSAAGDNDLNVNLQLTGAGTGYVALWDNSRVLSSTILIIRLMDEGGVPLNGYTTQAPDAGRLITVDSNFPQTVTIPVSTNVNYPEGTFIDVARLGAGAVTIAGEAGVSLFATPGLKISARFAQARLTKIGPDSWLVTGSLSA